MTSVRHCGKADSGPSEQWRATLSTKLNRATFQPQASSRSRNPHMLAAKQNKGKAMSRRPRASTRRRERPRPLRDRPRCCRDGELSDVVPSFKSEDKNPGWVALGRMGGKARAVGLVDKKMDMPTRCNSLTCGSKNKFVNAVQRS